MTNVFEPSCFNVLDESMQECVSKYTFPAWVCVGRKSRPFGNERHTIACGLSTIMWYADILEVRDRSCERGRPDFGELGKIVVTMMRFKRSIWNC